MENGPQCDPVSYDVPLNGDESGPLDPAASEELARELLEANALWFCRLRWIVVATFLALGGVVDIPAVRNWTGLRPLSAWLFLTAGVLTLANLMFHPSLVQRTSCRLSRRRVELNLWGQILVDLTVLTAAIHFVGAGIVWLPFVYLFHIILACIFFRSSLSLGVTFCAAGLYLGLRLAEAYGLVESQSVFDGVSGFGAPDPCVFARGINVAGTVLVWFVAWGLVSHLARLVRSGERRLVETNAQLRRAQQERTEHMLRTTHELKSPFAAISANAQLLLKGYCGDLTPKARGVIEKIAVRCERLAHEIQEMLQLANLNSAAQAPPPDKTLALDAALRRAAAQFEPLFRERELKLDLSVEPVQVRGAPGHLQMLIQNLLSNAAAYSKPGGRVGVACGLTPDGEVFLSVTDEGIGIPAAKLPLIFDAHYRTDEAVRLNPYSSGLGLAILKEAAQCLRARIQVQSAPGKGTTFRVYFPAVPVDVRWNGPDVA